MNETIERLISRFRDPEFRKINKAHEIATKAELHLSFRRLQDHALAGGRPLYVVRSLVEAHELGFETSFEEIAAIDLKRNYKTTMISQAVKRREEKILSLSSTKPLPIKGYTLDQSLVFAEILVGYRLTLKALTFDYNKDRVFQLIALHVASNIFETATLTSLRSRKPDTEHEIMQHYGDDGIEIVSIDITYITNIEQAEEGNG